MSANGFNVDGLTPTSMPRPEGQPPRGRMLVDRYEVFETIGSGLMGQVYRAWDHQVERVVAIKILAPYLAAERRVADAFERENARLAALPEHPDIVSVYEVRGDGDEPYIVMQFVLGGNLRDLLRQEASLPFDEAFRIGRQIGLGLDFALRYGMVHGDLKPENVLVPHNGHAKVSDFGVWDVLQQSQATRPLFADTRDLYAAPEVAMGAKPSQRSDIYSLGALLFEMLTGTPPSQFGASLYDSLVHSTAAVPPSAAAVITRALDEDPDSRYRTPGEFAAALHEHLLQEKGETPTYFYMPPVNAPRTEPEPPPPSTPEPETVAASTAAAPSVVQPARPQPASEIRTTVVKKKRSIGFTSVIWLLVVLLAIGGGVYAYRAVDRLLNGPSQTNHPAAAVTTHSKKPKGITRRRTVVKRPAPVATGGCPTAQTGDVRLTNIYVSEIRPLANQPVTLSYTVTNSAPQCRRVVLRFRALSDSPSGPVLSGSTGDKLTSAPPGAHVLQRSFVFPTSASGQRFDAEFTVTDPSDTLSYGVWRAPGLIVVS